MSITNSLYNFKLFSFTIKNGTNKVYSAEYVSPDQGFHITGNSVDCHYKKDEVSAFIDSSQWVVV